MDELTLTLQHPLTDEEWDAIVDVDFEYTNEITFYTKNGKKVDFVKKPQWIPCSERLPENGRQVLAYARSVHYALAKYDEMREADGSYKKQWVTFDAWKPFYKVKDVIAWMPLPSPYQPEEELE